MQFLGYIAGLLFSGTLMITTSTFLKKQPREALASKLKIGASIFSLTIISALIAQLLISGSGLAFGDFTFFQYFTHPLATLDANFHALTSSMFFITALGYINTRYRLQTYQRFIKHFFEETT